VAPIQSRILGRATKFVVDPPKEEIDINVFFQTRDDLFVWDTFQKILSWNIPVQAVDPVILYRRRLLKFAHDHEIEAVFPADGYEVPLWVIAKMVRDQMGRNPGPLPINTARAIFYTPESSVYVYWHHSTSRYDHYNGWAIGANPGLSDHQSHGSIVFSC
jgi:hypothetical protein